VTAWVRTDCPDCGSLYLPAHEVAAWMLLPAVECSYSFACLNCRRLVERPCSTNTLDQLARCGVHLTTVIVSPDGASTDPRGIDDAPVGPVHRAGAAAGPLREADAETFARLLADDDAFVRALRQLGVS
jgi:hypothetical protein